MRQALSKECTLFPLNRNPEISKKLHFDQLPKGRLDDIRFFERTALRCKTGRHRVVFRKVPRIAPDVRSNVLVR